MNYINKDKYLFEEMSLCWHTLEPKPYHTTQRCSKCETTEAVNINLSTPEGFFLLWEWAKKQEWWYYFVAFYHSKNSIHENKWWWETLIDPTRFRDALFTFLMENENGR